MLSYLYSSSCITSGTAILTSSRKKNLNCGKIMNTHVYVFKDATFGFARVLSGSCVIQIESFGEDRTYSVGMHYKHWNCAVVAIVNSSVGLLKVWSIVSICGYFCSSSCIACGAISSRQTNFVGMRQWCYLGLTKVLCGSWGIYIDSIGEDDVGIKLWCCGRMNCYLWIGSRPYL